MSPLSHQALTTAAAIWLAVLAASAAHLPEPWWAGISAWMVANPNHDAVVSKSLMRFAGTILGCIAGYGYSVLCGGDIVPLAVGLAGVVGYCTIWRLRVWYAYAVLLGSVTFLMVVAASLETPAQLFPFAVFRGVEISVGIVAYLLVALLAPSRSATATGTGAGPAAATQSEQSEKLEIEQAALVAGLLPPVFLLLWSWFDLPSLTQMLITGVALVDRDIGAMRAKDRQRLAGCLLGGSIGLAITVLVAPQALVSWSLVLLAGMFMLAHIHHGDAKTAYVGTQGGLAFIMALVTGPGPAATIVPMVDRLAGMFIGIVVLVGFVALVRPLFACRTAQAA